MRNKAFDDSYDKGYDAGHAQGVEAGQRQNIDDLDLIDLLVDLIVDSGTLEAEAQGKALAHHLPPHLHATFLKGFNRA